MIYLYGMKFRGFSPGCQPMEGFVEVREDVMGEYHNVLVYDRVLSKKEEDLYELDYIGKRLRI